jgi:hypothetical protein
MAVMLAPVKIEEEFLSLPEAAKLLTLSHVQFWRLVRAGKISVIQVGTTASGKKVAYGVRREAVDTLLEERRKPTAP